ncbi:MAG: hypothetical protein B7X12_06405 [Halothiobacillus sp. 20-53-49]|nr:MAG: hypothetical protein B7X12_06405 [Halothiobacillus sp. 20-53-49]
MGFTLTTTWLSRRAIWVPNGLILGLLGFAGVLLARSVWLVLAPLPQPVAAVSSAVPSAVATAPQTLASEISAWHLFGTAMQPMPQNATAVQPSSLGLQLEGIIAGSQPPLVMLRVGSEVRLLQVGDQVTAQVKISAIEPDRVLISNQGRLEAIAFPKPVGLNSAPPPSASLGLGGGQSAPNASRPASGASGDAAEVMKNPQSLMRFVTVAPLQEHGALTGYALRPVPGQEAFMQQLGLEPGDVLTSVDGMPVTDPALLPRVMPLLSSGQPLNVLIERGGQPMSVTINLDSLR